MQGADWMDMSIHFPYLSLIAPPFVSVGMLIKEMCFSGDINFNFFFNFTKNSFPIPDILPANHVHP